VSLNALDATIATIPTVAMMNKAKVFVRPESSVFPYNQSELPRSIASPDWNKLNLNTSGMFCS
jgi:hypothetical protein